VYDAKNAKMKVRRLRKLDPVIQTQLGHWGGKTVKRLKQYTLEGGILNARTRHLKGSIGNVVSSPSAHVSQVAVGSGVGSLIRKQPVKYARIHEVGGVIRPKKGKYLAIPMPDGSIRLKTQVTIPARRWLSRTIDEMMPYLNQLLRAETLAKVMGVK
jgi:phage gpG-like protein